MPSIRVGADFSTADYKIFIEDLGKIPFMEAVMVDSEQKTVGD